MPYPCSVCYQDATLACSGCKYQRYCSYGPLSKLKCRYRHTNRKSQSYSAECQKADWKTHKKGCKLQQTLNKFNDERNAKPRARPRMSHCTGCNVKFSEDYPCDDECPTCGYVACESCICHHSRGKFCWQCGHRFTVSHMHTSDSDGVPSGTCYCAGSNFGRKYCEMEPRWYHMDGDGKAYDGDRHPYSFPDEPYREEVYEPDPRACNNCGKVTQVFKKEYCQPVY